MTPQEQAAAKRTERAPLLSWDERAKLIANEVDKDGAADAIREWYEAKITSGELITKKEHERLLKEAEDGASFRWSE